MAAREGAARPRDQNLTSASIAADNLRMNSTWSRHSPQQQGTQHQEIKSQVLYLSTRRPRLTRYQIHCEWHGHPSTTDLKHIWLTPASTQLFQTHLFRIFRWLICELVRSLQHVRLHGDNRKGFSSRHRRNHSSRRLDRWPRRDQPTRSRRSSGRRCL